VTPTPDPGSQASRRPPRRLVNLARLTPQELARRARLAAALATRYTTDPDRPQDGE